MKYKTIASKSESKITIKGSKFLGYAFPVESLEQIESILYDIRKKYYDATHHCYAWQLGNDKDMTFRYNDDGEPSGTAGKPIYGAIQRLDLTNVLIVSVRYYGGTKLGTGGLIRAYGQSASDTLETAKIKIVVVGDTLQFISSYEHHPIIMRIVNKYHLISFDQDFAETVKVTLEVEENLTEKILNEVKDATNGVVLGDVVKT
ncbi:MAG: YigZ family protein [Candidatus Marinimicrobia bacterium]|nr:YigZ family protein [Candidatus Neomarinimicrobiota bacterium]